MIILYLAHLLIETRKRPSFSRRGRSSSFHVDERPPARFWKERATCGWWERKEAPPNNKNKDENCRYPELAWNMCHPISIGIWVMDTKFSSGGENPALCLYREKVIESSGGVYIYMFHERICICNTQPFTFINMKKRNWKKWGWRSAHAASATIQRVYCEGPELNCDTFAGIPPADDSWSLQLFRERKFSK